VDQAAMLRQIAGQKKTAPDDAPEAKKGARHNKISVISITSGNVLSIFPVNTFFWLAVTATIVIVAADARAIAPVTAPQRAPLPASQPADKKRGRFISRAVHPMPQS
jgi:hypothetical protein